MKPIILKFGKKWVKTDPIILKFGLEVLPPEESEEIILDDNTLILPSLSFREYDDLTLSFNREVTREPKELNANFRAGFRSKYYLTIPKDNSLKLPNMNYCPPYMDMFYGKNGCTIDAPKELNADFAFGTTLNYRLDRVRLLSESFAFGSTVNAKITTDYIKLDPLVLCQYSNGELVLGGKSCIDRIELNARFKAGFDLSYGKLEFGERKEDVSFLFGSSFTPGKLHKQLKSSKLSFGSKASYDLEVDRRMITGVEFGSTASYEFAKRPLIGGELAFGSTASYEFAPRKYLDAKFNGGFELNYIIANKPAQFRPIFKFGIESSLEYWQLGDIDLIRTRYNCNGLTYPHYDNDIIDLADDLLEDAHDSDLWLVSSCNITYRKRMPDVSFKFGSQMVEPAKNYINKITYMRFGSTVEPYGMYEYDVMMNLCPDAFIENGENVITDYNETIGLCGGFKFVFGSIVSTGRLVGVWGLPFTFKFGVECTNTPSIAQYKYTCKFGAKSSVKFTRLWQLSYTCKFGGDIDFKFTMPSHNMYFGASCSYEMTSIYNIEFTEDGCLDNEFIPVDMNGNPIQELVRKQTLEGDQFSHVIKARIYH